MICLEYYSYDDCSTVPRKFVRRSSFFIDYDAFEPVKVVISNLYSHRLILEYFFLPFRLIALMELE